MKPSFSALHTAIILLSCAILIGVVVVATSTIQRETDTASSVSTAAWLASRLEGQTLDLTQTLAGVRQEFLASDRVRGLAPSLQADLARELSRTDDGATSEALAKMAVDIPLPAVVTTKGLVDSMNVEVAQIIGLVGRDDGSELARLAAATTTAQDAYFAEPTVDHFRSLRLRVSELRDKTRILGPRLIRESDAHRSPVLHAASSARVVAVIAALAAATAAVIAAWNLRRREQASIHLTSTLTRRNDQFAALYNVFSEITDTLSLRYVVRTTLHEVIKLMHADVVVLRLLKGDELYVAGSLNREGQEVGGLRTVQLGEGLMGRTAKRGKTLRIDSDAESQMSEGQRLDGAQAGIAAPLIVGARVVGTLACWSLQARAFSADDEQILEMMASQVAIAVTAADITETNDRRAHVDALTGLPNRRQLAEDLSGALDAIADAGTPLAIAMVDIDHFKSVNDDLGHRVGDVTLQKVASVLRASIRECDYVYRYGGEEFLIVYANVGADEAGRLAERLRAQVQATPLTGESLEPIGPVTISVGLALLPEQTRDLNEAILLADRAMYHAKDAGRNRVMLAAGDTRLVAA